MLQIVALPIIAHAIKKQRRKEASKLERTSMKKLLILAPMLLIGFGCDAQSQTPRPGEPGWVNTGARRGYCYTFRMNQCGGSPVAWSRREKSCVCVGGDRQG
jgi:hypothetical protein